MPVKAKIRVEGRLAFVETELGQKAVVPVDSLCELLRRYRLEPTGYKPNCPSLEYTGVKLEVDEYAGAGEED